MSLWPLDPKKQYLVKRTGRSDGPIKVGNTYTVTAKVNQYILQTRGIKKYYWKYTDDLGTPRTATLRKGSGFWEVLKEVKQPATGDDDAIPQTLYVRRIKNDKYDTTFVVGEIYECKIRDESEYVETYNVIAGNRGYAVTLTALRVSSFWEIIEDNERPQEEGITMETFKSITKGTILNGLPAEQFTDTQIIAMIDEVTKQHETLRNKVGAGSKYFKAKGEEMMTNIVALHAELDSRA